MKKPNTGLRQLVDWNAAFWAGIISGTVSLAVSTLLAWRILGSPMVALRLMASILLGSDVMQPPAGDSLGIVLAALFVQFVLSLVFAFITAVVVHRWGLLVSFFGGALLGLALYAINFYSISYFFPWLYQFRSSIFMLAHVAFGAIAGLVYELLEVETFVPVEKEGK